MRYAQIQQHGQSPYAAHVHMKGMGAVWVGSIVNVGIRWKKGACNSRSELAIHLLFTMFCYINMTFPTSNMWFIFIIEWKQWMRYPGILLVIHIISYAWRPKECEKATLKILQNNGPQSTRIFTATVITTTANITESLLLAEVVG